jgi:hypothetical protein
MPAMGKGEVQGSTIARGHGAEPGIRRPVADMLVE